jgi:hypothetical protein
MRWNGAVNLESHKVVLSQGNLPFHAFSWVQPQCGKDACNRDLRLSIHAKNIPLTLYIACNLHMHEEH